MDKNAHLNDVSENSENIHKKRNFPFTSLYDENLSEVEVKQQIPTLLIAGYDTSAATISFVILMLAMHPDIQEQVFDELHSVFDTQNEDTTCEHLSRLNTLDRVIKETLRLFPPAPLIGRISTTDFPLPNCTIPKGATIAMSIFTMHRVK